MNKKKPRRPTKAPRSNLPRDGRLVAISGGTRSGKTEWTKRAAGRAPRVIVWDVEDQWSELPGFVRVTDRAALAAACKQVRGAARLAYVPRVPSRDEFDFWAQCAYHWGRWCGPCAVVAEELGSVSVSGKAPGWWNVLITRGLKRGISIYAITQRWADADKTTLGNAQLIVIFRGQKLDIDYMADRCGAAVPPLEPLEHVEFDATTGRLSPKKCLKF